MESKQTEDTLPAEEVSTIPLDKLTITKSTDNLVTKTPKSSNVTNDPDSVDSIMIQEGYFYSDSLPVRSVLVGGDWRDIKLIPSNYYSSLDERCRNYVFEIDRDGYSEDPNFFDYNYEEACTIIRLSDYLKHSLEPLQKEIAALVRCACMRLSILSEPYATDPIRYRFIRNCTPKGITTVKIQHPEGFPSEEMSIVVTTLDVFEEICSGRINGFLPEAETAIPIRSSKIRSPWILAYIASFMDSKLWSGTVMMKSEVTSPGPDGTSVHLKYTMTPVCNSVRIPGAVRVMLVIVDQRKGTLGPLNWSGKKIDIWNGKGDPVRNDFGPIWKAYWTTENSSLQYDLFHAYNELCQYFGIEDTIDIAASIAAELYGIWYPGLALDSTNDQPEPDYSESAYGAWTVDGSALDDTGRIKSERFPLKDTNRKLAGRMCAGYNFAGHSSLHLFCDGEAKTQCTVLPDGTVDVVWISEDHDQSRFRYYPSYRVPTMGSLFRVATYIGIIRVNEPELACSLFLPLIHQLSCILGFSTSVMMVNNDFTTREWSGLSSGADFESDQCTKMFENLKNELFGKFIMHKTWNSTSQPCIDSIADYFGELPLDNPQWMTFSAIPYHCNVQWSERMGLLFGHRHIVMHEFFWETCQKCLFVMPITREFGHHKSRAVGTIDVYRYFPQIFMSLPNDRLKHWFDQVSYYAHCPADKELPVFGHTKNRYESFTFAGRTKSFSESFLPISDFQVVGSNYLSADSCVYKTSTSTIQVWMKPNYRQRKLKPNDTGIFFGLVFVDW